MRLVLFSLPLAASLLRGRDRRIQLIAARKRPALVVGNLAYANDPLRNSVNDVQGIARRLRGLNYDVALVTGAGREAMGVAVDQFIGKPGTGDVALFCYSGHGTRIESEIYQIPVDFAGQSEADVRHDAHPAERIQERMEPEKEAI